MGLSRGVKGCIGKYLAVELLMKTTRPDAMDVGFLVWQFGGDTCLILPILCSVLITHWARETRIKQNWLSNLILIYAGINTTATPIDYNSIIAQSIDLQPSHNTPRNSRKHGTPPAIWLPQCENENFSSKPPMI